MRLTICAALVVAILSENAAFADDRPSMQDANTPYSTVPVFEDDIDRPYFVIGDVRDNLRKHFAFQAHPTKDKIYAEIWERAKKMGADAVIFARYGATKGSLFNHGSTPISGTAIKCGEATKSVR